MIVSKPLMHIFTFLCFSATISMIGYWTHEYFKDNDLSFVDYKYTKDAKQPYPTFSLCFMNPFLEKSLRKQDSSLKSCIEVASSRNNANRNQR